MQIDCSQTLNAINNEETLDLSHLPPRHKQDLQSMDN